MKILLWGLVAFLLIGDGLFVLPWHFSDHSLETRYDINYKKDSLLLRNVFPDSGIQLQLNLPPGYDSMYENTGIRKKKRPDHILMVNASVFHNLDFMGLAFPFYKITHFKGVVPFFSIIKASNAPGMDSTALIGNMVISGKIKVAGICTPQYARTLVEKSLVTIIQREMNKIEQDINRPPAADTIAAIPPPAYPPPRPALHRRKK